MTSAFVSYAREDRAFVGHLAEALRARSITPAWDQDHSVLPFSAPWRQEIESAIRSADKFVFVISPYSISSVPCASEIASAQASGKQIVPIAFRLPPDISAVPPAIAELNWIFFDGTTPFPHAVDQLVGALTTDLEWVRTHTRLSTRAAEWVAAGRDSSTLLRGGDLRAAEAWIADAATHPQTPPTEAQRQYLAASRRNTDRNSRRWRFALIGGLVVALTLAVIAVLQRNQARHEATVASAHALAARASAELATDPANALHLALQSTKTAVAADGTRVLRDALAADRERMVLDPGSGAHTQAVWSPTTDTIATTGKGDVVFLWDARTGRLIRTLAAMPDGHYIEQLSYDPTGKWLAAISQYGDLALYSTASGQTFDTGQANGFIQAALNKSDAKDGTTSVTWDPQSGRLFVYGPELSDVVVVDPAKSHTFTLRAANPIQSMTFAPHGSRAFVSWDVENRYDDLVDLAKGNHTTLPVLTPGVEYQSCWTPDGSELVVWAPTEAQDQTVHVLNGATGAQLFTHVGRTTSAGACGMNVDAEPFAILGDYQGQASLVQERTVEVRQGAPKTPQFAEIGLRGHTAQINSVATSPDGGFAVSGGDDGTVRVWDAVSGAQRTFADPGGVVDSVGFSPDNGMVLAVLANGHVAVYDAGTGEPAVRLSAPPGAAAYALGFVANGTKVWGFTQHLVVRQGVPTTATVTDLHAVVWNASTGAMLESVPITVQLSAPHCPQNFNSNYPDCIPSPLAAEQNGVAISADGNELVYATGHSVVERNLASGRQTTLTVAQPPTHVLMSADGTRVLVVADDGLRVWTPAGGQARTISLAAVPLAAGMDPAGDRAVIGNTDGTTSVWNLVDGTRVAQFGQNPVLPNDQQNPEPLQVAISSDGTMIGTGDTNGLVRLRSVADGRLITSYVLGGDPGANAARYPTTYPAGELRFVESDRELLAVNYPQIQAGDTLPPGVGVLIDVATGTVHSQLSSPGQSEPPFEPGVDVSADGQFVLTGVEGFAPAGQEQGEDAVYDTTTGDKLADLSEAAPAVSQTGLPNNLAVENAWSPSGTRLVTASTGIYPCDACGSLADMQAQAQLRIAWEAPIGPHSTPPPGNPLG